MPKYDLMPMKYDSKEQIDAIVILEQQCKQFEQIHINVGIEHLVKEDGDHALLCYHHERLIGLLSWYTSDGSAANINGMVHPDYRRQGVFRSLLQRAKEDMKPQELQTLSFRVPSGSQSGFGFVEHMKASFQRSEYAMTLAHLKPSTPRHTGLRLRLMQPQDFEFMVLCSSQSFAESEEWTREYFSRTNEPSRMTYIAMLNRENVGIIRINHINPTTAVVHDFCILPTHQGKGLGHEVLTKAVAILVEEQRAHIRLGVVTENERALNLYRNVGFEVTSENQYYNGNI
ncbi:GNAT family N-acetyltransferase [Paenibacillus sp. PL91]|uniref:GNAT family N-acetyltransferase n=1 Tax=Paenibacillus sp. PL91 TaxID=2729538 RepID=UPI00145FAC69|nr:GNAT family N-acetyltransferase [Paenibacillus sp. PL91]MBC9201136.1 GNAT family N-acetyltransferase [Paenibacillus sp. PL91]